MKYLSSLLLAVLAVSSAFAADKPNILFIYLDDFGWRDTGFMGSDFYETPNLDRLAKQSLVFTDAYAAAANCAPSRACLLSGQYTPRHEIYNVGTKPRGKARDRKLEHVPGVDVLDPKIRTWAHQIQSAGYTTGTFGKWHLSGDPLPYGFDVNVGGDHRGSPPRGYYPPHPKAAGLGDASKDEYLTDRLTDEVDRFIRTNKEKPWLAYLTHFAVHTPIQAKKKLLAKYEAKRAGHLHENAKMATMIQAVDDGVRKLIRTLKELKLTEKTIILFYSDNGGYGPGTDMDPLKGYKGTYYEGGIRVPFFVHWPGVVEPGWTTEPIIGVDLFPTLCEMADADVPEQPLDGRTLVPLLKGDVETLGQRPLYWHFPAYLQSYRGMTDEQRDPLFRSRPCSVMRKGSWKLHHYFEDDALELYHLGDDIGEVNDLAIAERQRAQTMLGELNQWRESINAPMPPRK